MGITFRHYTNEPNFTNDFFKVFNFLKSCGAEGFNENWHWARWEWLISHPNLEKEMLPIIGLWEDGAEVVGIATHDMRRGDNYLVCRPGFDFLKPEMLKYAEDNLSVDGVLRVAARNMDLKLIELLEKNNYIKTSKTEKLLSLNCGQGALQYCLPEGFTVSCFAENRDLNKYIGVIHKGFDNVGEPPFIDESSITPQPHFDPQLKVFIIAPDGEYAAHCGIWYEPGTEKAYVEPVVCIPKYRKLGLAKAAVYEAVNRCSTMGAKSAIVISDQQFYYRIGFKKSSEYTFYEKKKH